LILFKSYIKKATIANKNIYIYIYIKKRSMRTKMKKTKTIHYHVELKDEITNKIFVIKGLRKKERNHKNKD